MPNYYSNYNQYPYNQPQSYGQQNQNSYGYNQPAQSYGGQNYSNGAYVMGNSYGNMPVQPMNYSGGTAMSPNNNGIIWVQGEAGAKAYPVGAGNTVMLMDSESSTFYIKQTDDRGFPMPLEIYDYTKRANQSMQIPSNTSGAMNNMSNSSGNVIDTQFNTEEYVTKKEFDELKKMLEEMNNNIKHSNNQSYGKGNKNA